MAKNLVDGTNIIIEENADNINLELSQNYKNNLPKNINIYSTSETVIGTWIDGKPIYRKTINTGVLTNGNNDISFDGSHIDTLINSYGFIHVSGQNGQGWQPIPRTYSGETFYIGIGNFRETSFRIQIGTNYDAIDKSYATIEYTKTTD